jgi:hypothetical protein
MHRHVFIDANPRGAVVIVPAGSVEHHCSHCPLDVEISVPSHLAVRRADLPVLVVRTRPEPRVFVAWKEKR